MSGGEQSAKQMLYAEAEKQAERLENGAGSDPAELAKGIAMAIRLLKPLYTFEFVTPGELTRRLAEYRVSCPVHAKHLEREEALRRSGIKSTLVLFAPVVRDLAIAIILGAFIYNQLEGLLF